MLNCCQGRRNSYPWMKFRLRDVTCCHDFVASEPQSKQPSASFLHFFAAMGPSRRNGPRKLVQYSSDSSAPPQSPVSHRHTTPGSSQPPPSLGMSPSSRYQHNLKVLRRRDPSILSVFDQFSH